MRWEDRPWEGDEGPGCWTRVVRIPRELQSDLLGS